MLLQLEVAGVFFAIFATLAIVAERMRPARPVDYRRALPADLLAFTLYQIVVYPVAITLSDPAFAGLHLPYSLGIRSGLPLALRVLAFYLCADLGSYLLHRVMHTRWVWRIHKFHHSPTVMWWMAGARGSIQQQFLFNLPYAVFIPLIYGAPRWVYLAIMVEGIFRNIWMHLNCTWRSNWIEAVFVTPRFHHLHHSDEPQHRDANFGSLFSLWDRLFRTYRDPDAGAPQRFGNGETADTERGRRRLFVKQQIGFF